MKYRALPIRDRGQHTGESEARRRDAQDTTMMRDLELLRVGVLLGLGREEHRVDVGDDTTRGDRDVLEQLVQLLVVADGQLDVAGDDAHTLVVARGVASQLEDLSSEVLEHGSEVHGRTGSDTGGIAAITELTVDTTDRELETGASRTRDGGGRGLLASAASLGASSLGGTLRRHVDEEGRRRVRERRDEARGRGGGFRARR